MRRDKAILEAILKVMEKLNIPVTQDNICTAAWLVREYVKPNSTYAAWDIQPTLENQVEAILSRTMDIGKKVSYDA